jgi:hypothetical protein
VKCEIWNPLLEARAIAFLQERYASSLFLLSNFCVLLEGERIFAVFAHTRRGNLLVSGEAHPLILAGALEDRIPITGVISGWEIASAVWAELGSPTYSFSSKEIL